MSSLIFVKKSLNPRMSSCRRGTLGKVGCDRTWLLLSGGLLRLIPQIKDPAIKWVKPLMKNPIRQPVHFTKNPPITIPKAVAIRVRVVSREFANNSFRRATTTGMREGLAVLLNKSIPKNKKKRKKTGR